MPERGNFAKKFLTRLDRLDQQSVKNYIADLAEDYGLYQSVLDEIHEGVILFTPDGKAQFVNRQAELWLGIKQDKVQKGNLINELKDKPLAQFIKNNLKNVSAKIVEDIQVLVPKEISLRVYLLAPVNARNKERLIILENITESKNVETDNARLARIDAMVRLASGLAHEIGNPLNSLSIHLELLKKEVKSLPPAKQGGFTKTLDILNSETSRLDRFVRNFLKATRRPPLRFRSENINNLIEEAIQVMLPQFEERDCSIHFRPDTKLSPYLMDRERLHQAFINLIKNALEAMKEDGLLDIHVSHKDNVVLVRFRDNGNGIAEKDLSHIFEAYFTTKDEGSGLGLMMVYDAVVEHGGRIEVASKAGEGTTFTLMMPIRKTKLQLTHEIKASTS